MFINAIDTYIDKIKLKLEGKRHRFYTDIVGSILFILFALLVFYVMPSQVQIKEGSTNGRTFPTLLMFIIIGCSAILLIKNLIAIIQKKAISFVEIEVLTEIRALIIFALFLLYYFMLKIIGFIPASVVFSFLMLCYFRCKKKSYYIIGVVVAILIGVLFQYVFKVRLP